MKLSKGLLFIALLIGFFTIGNSAEGAGFVFAKNLTIGVRGVEVTALQQFLIDGGFLKILAPTGYFGPVTRSALGAWQKSVGITPSVGYFGVISRARINATAKQVPIIPTPTAIATTTISVEAPVALAGAPVLLVGTTTVPVVNKRDGSPVRLTIPKIGVDAGFQYTGLKSDGVMEIPNNIFDIGWYTGSVRPGEKGVSVITGHVAQIRGGVAIRQGVFNSLNELRPGDKLYVQNDKGETITFVVRESRSYYPAADATTVFTAADDGTHLNVITCEGIWSPEKLSYSQRLVIFTDVVQY
jgi:sortase (surface protein transpeptidase)